MAQELYFRQLLAGRDFAVGNPIATQMVNFVYLIGDLKTRDCVVVDPAWDVTGIINLAERDEMRIIGALATHYHPDHVGGDLFGRNIEGLAALLAQRSVKVHVHKEEVPGLRMLTGLSYTDIERRESGDILQVGNFKIEFLHTPGHTPGSQCFRVLNRLVSGDTLFIKGCGRVDLPGGDPAKMYESLTQKLARLPDDTILFPGHHYADVPTSTIGQEKKTNHYLRIRSLEEWLRLMN